MDVTLQQEELEAMENVVPTKYEYFFYYFLSSLLVVLTIWGSDLLTLMELSQGWRSKGGIEDVEPAWGFQWLGYRGMVFCSFNLKTKSWIGHSIMLLHYCKKLSQVILL